MASVTQSLSGPATIPGAPDPFTPGTLQRDFLINSVPAGVPIIKITFSIDLTHASDGHLLFTLRDPDDNSILLSTSNGGEGDNYTQTVFDDSAAVSIVAGSPPFTGSFRPEEPLAELLPGDINGTWKLSIGNSGAAGTLNVASITITYNAPPTGVAINPTTSSITENTSTAARIKVADIAIADDGEGANTLSFIGADAAFFEIVGTELFLKAGTILDFETKHSYSVAVQVDDGAFGTGPEATSGIFTLTVGDVSPETVTGTATSDTLNGTSGADAFVFNTALDKKTNIDTILNFSAADDIIFLDNAIFTKLKNDGALKSKYFEVGKKADDGNDFIVYNKKTGDLSYDKNGDHKGGAVLFAVLEGSPNDISKADFFVI